MISEILKKARDYETEQLKKLLPKEYPEFHVTGVSGWINDPNGFSVYQGEYHLFYQYHPYSNEWGPMHWGHVKSHDMLRWERLPIAMAPDKSYDNGGCFSGSAVELSDGRHLLMYTGVQVTDNADGSICQRQTQCMAVGDGVNYEKYKGNPVIIPESLPEGGIVSDFRDPKIWMEDGIFYSVEANMDTEGNGQVILYRSEDGFSWEYCSILDESRGKLGKMWECPDFFALDGKQLLLISPMAMKPVEGKFHVGHGTVAILGTYDKENYSFEREAEQPIDWGIDFYAPQSIKTPDGRRVIIGWLQNWANSKSVPDHVKYFGQMSVPRELSVKNGWLYQAPIRELEKYHGEKTEYKDVMVNGEASLDGIFGRVLDMTIHLKPQEDLEEFGVKIAADSEHFTCISYDPKKKLLCMDRSFSGYLYDIVHTRNFPIYSEEKDLRLRFVMDRFSLELFINNGRQAATMAIYTPLTADQILFFAKGNANIHVEKYDLEFSKNP